MSQALNYIQLSDGPVATEERGHLSRLAGRHAGMLEEAFEDPELYTVYGLYRDDRLVGVAIVSTIVVLKKVEIECLNFDANVVWLEATIDFLRYMEEALDPEKYSSLVYVYNRSLHVEDSKSLVETLSQTGWHAPKLLLTRYVIELSKLQLPWDDNPRTLPGGIEFFPWTELTREERKKIDKGLEQGLFTRDVYPYHEKEGPELINSVGLRHEGNVVGWMATSRYDDDTICYGSLYLHRNYRALGLAPALMQEAIRLHRGSDVPYAMWEINPEQVDDRWQGLVSEVFIPQSVWSHEILCVWKKL